MGFLLRRLDKTRELRAVTSSRVIDLIGRLQLKLAENPNNPLLVTAMHQIEECQVALETFAPRASSLAVAQIHFDAAFILYLRAADCDETGPVMPAILGAVRENLPPGDLRRKAVEDIVEEVSSRGIPSITESDRETVLDTLAAANQARINRSLRVRSFVRIVAMVGLLLTIVALSVAALGALRHTAVPLCFVPQTSKGAYFTACPLRVASGGTPSFPNQAATDPGDYLVVEIVGLVSAGLAAATALRQMRGNTTPYNVSLVLAALKLPTGALTAPLGLLFIRGGFVPGLSALDSSAQIIAWAIVFGYSQQILTRLVDNQAKSILGDPQGDSKNAADPADRT
ncbi:MULTISPECIES: hypothetical protein [unclassified Streptomyces]|uniref:hypothetical protein n=1 Tax=unclassified Streptomyces TaxID=2593676 RepID=UPI00364BFC45